MTADILNPGARRWSGGASENAPGPEPSQGTTHAGAYNDFPHGPSAYRDHADGALEKLFRAAILHAPDRINWYDKKAFHVENRGLVGVATLSVFTGAFVGETIRGGIESIGTSQLDSAKAIGLTRRQTYLYVIFPQAIRVILPSLAGMFANLVKDSALLSVISIEDFTWNAQQVAALTFNHFECYLVLAGGYLVLTLPITLGAQYLERRTKYET